ncbi:MAG: hypothetical protein ACRD2N_16935 [Vicinamibacterales bacterium]
MVSFSLGVTGAGSLIADRNVSSRDIRVAPIDLASGRLTGPPTSFSRGFLEGPRVPDWSPDGKYLAYQACGGDCLAVRSVESSEVRRSPLFPSIPPSRSGHPMGGHSFPRLAT